MDWEAAKNDIHAFGVGVKAKWRDLTDDDMAYLHRGDGKRFVLAIGERYGLSSRSIIADLEAILAKVGDAGRASREDKKTETVPQEGRERTRGAQRKAEEEDRPHPS